MPGTFLVSVVLCPSRFKVYFGSAFKPSGSKTKGLLLSLSVTEGGHWFNDSGLLDIWGRCCMLEAKGGFKFGWGFFELRFLRLPTDNRWTCRCKLCMSKLKRTMMLPLMVHALVLTGRCLKCWKERVFCNVNRHLTENSAENVFTGKIAKIIF